MINEQRRTDISDQDFDVRFNVQKNVAGGGFQQNSLERKKTPKPLYSTLNVNVTHKKTPLIEWRFL
jgi:hypothetical protein